MAKKKVIKRKRVKKLTPSERHELYFVAARYAVSEQETDVLIRTIMAAGLASTSDIIPGTILAQDLTLLRWVLRKMQENRMVAMQETELCEKEDK